MDELQIRKNILNEMLRSKLEFDKVMKVRAKEEMMKQNEKPKKKFKYSWDGDFDFDTGDNDEL